MMMMMIWLIDGTLKGTTTPGQSGSESNSKGVFDTSQISRTGTSSSDAIVPYPRHPIFVGGLTPLLGKTAYSKPC